MEQVFGEKKFFFLGSLGFVCIALVVVYLFMTRTTNTPVGSVNLDQGVQQEQEVAQLGTEQGDMDGSVVAVSNEGAESLPKAPQQVDFTTPEAAYAYAEAGPTVLFFKANWCPTCQAAQRELDSSLQTLPAGTTIVTVDYDTEDALKDRYGITYQHTWVQVDQTGAAVTKWNGGGIQELRENIER